MLDSLVVDIHRLFTHQQNLYSTQDVHGAGEGRAQVETQTYGSTKLWAK